MDGIWTLPGPARFARTAHDRLERGDSVLIGLPALICGDDDFPAGLRQAVDIDFDVVIEATGSEDRPVASVVADKLGADLEPGKDAAVRLANDPAIEGRYVAFTVSGKPTDTKPWTDFFRTFLAAARPIIAQDRPRFFITAGHGSATALTGTDPLAELWWWGVLDRFDTALHAQQCLAGREGSDLLRDTITEVAGYDLGLVGYLASEWTGDASTLALTLGGYAGPEWPSIPVPGQLPHTSTSWEAPPSLAVALWNAGLADAWDSLGLCLHPCSLSAQEQRLRIWRGQIRCLMPLIDEERARLEEWMRGEVRGLPKEKIIEAGDLYTLLQDNPRLKNWRGGHRKRLIYWLRDSRNALAHMTPLSPEDVAEGRRLIWRDRKLS
jgi:hypothetical protein